MITAKDLLYKALDFDGFWNNSKQIMKSTPSKYRQQQLDKLLKGFDISKGNAKSETQVPTLGNFITQTIYSTTTHPTSMSRLEYIETLTNFKYFTTGEFIADANRDKYQFVIVKVISSIKNIFPEQSEVIEKQPLNLVQLFRNLYNCRLGLHHSINFQYKWETKMRKEFSTEYDYSLHLQGNFIKSLETNFAEIDEIICLLIDPTKRTLSEKELDYPNFDFEAIDREWDNKNRK